MNRNELIRDLKASCNSSFPCISDVARWMKKDRAYVRWLLRDTERMKGEYTNDGRHAYFVNDVVDAVMKNRMVGD